MKNNIELISVLFKYGRTTHIIFPGVGWVGDPFRWVGAAWACILGIIVWDGPVAVKCGANLATLHGLEYAAGEGTQEREECVRGSMRSGKGMAAQGMISSCIFCGV